MNSLFGATLQKTASDEAWEVGGVASSFYKDLDGDTIHPSAVAEAIPAFMAQRGINGLTGGPIRLHHNFWQPLIQRAIALLSLDSQQQMDLVASIALPLGRVTRIWVDPSSGTCHWCGVLSAANPIARTIWQMLRENLVPLGVSVGGKILRTEPGRDRLGRPCNLITRIRLDELSITDNPALRLVEGEAEGNGAYITALAKSLGVNMQTTDSTPVERWLEKALGNAKRQLAPSSDPIKTGLGRGLNAPSSLRPRGTASVKMDGAQPTTGIGDRQPKGGYPQATSKGPNTDVWGMTVKELTQSLEKCCAMGKAELSSPETLGLLTDAAHGLAGVTAEPPGALVNLVRYLQYFSQFAQELPYMDDYQAQGTVEAMGPELHKALSDFKEGITDELSGSPLRPPGSPGVGAPQITFPSQYVQY